MVGDAGVVLFVPEAPSRLWRHAVAKMAKVAKSTGAGVMSIFWFAVTVTIPHGSV